MSRDVADVAVVGAGLSGLIAATALIRAGRSVIVLEAEPLAGGRMRRRRTAAGDWVDDGGQWVGPTQTRLIALSETLGVGRFDAHEEGATALLLAGCRSTFDGAFPPFEGEPPPLPAAEVADAARVWSAIEAIAHRVDPERPWRTPDATALDGETLASWIERTATTGFGRFMMTNFAALGGMGPFEPTEVSVLHQAWSHRVSPQGEHPEAQLFDGGAGLIGERLAGALGERLRLSTRVAAINQTADDVTLTTTSHVVRARHAVVALPPPETGRIDFQPALPAGRRALVEGMTMGTVIKVHAIYAAPFWRAMGLSGTGISDLEEAPFTGDSSPPGGTPAVLTTFIAGDAARRALADPPHRRRARVLAALVALFGPQAGSPLEVVEAAWPSPGHPGGGFTAHPAPGIWTSAGRFLRPAIGRVHWAGTEVATVWPGFLEGAVRAGEAAAAAVLAAG